MKATSTILCIALILVNFTDLNAQQRVENKEKSKITLQDIRNNIRIHTNNGIGKLKGNIDRGISETHVGYYSNDWEDFERNEYEYSTNRDSIIINHFNIYNENQEFEYSYSTEIVLDENGKIVSVHSDFTESYFIRYDFFHNENGRLDSLFMEESDEGISFMTEVRLFEITQDSLQFEITYRGGGEVEVDPNNFAVERDGNYIEYYVYPDWIDRYTNYNISISDISNIIIDDLFLFESYNDEYYPSSGYVPYSRTKFVEEEGVNTKLQTDYFDSGEWFPEGTIGIEYDSGGRIIELIDFYDDGGVIYNNERLTITYEQATNAEVSESLIPEGFVLNQNYPNPFNPSTNISFEVPINSFIELRVYDINGKEITVLESGFKTAGRYTVNFDASGLASGVYYYQLKIADQVQTKSMMLIK